MPRSKNIPLSDRHLRPKAVSGGDIFWRNVYRGCALGYRRTQSGGVWWVRKYDGRRYRKARLGAADDQGRDGLSYERAVKAAMKWDPDEEHHTPTASDYTVGDALSDYLKDYEARSDRDTKNLSQRIEKHIRPKIGHLRVADLTEGRLRRFRNALVKKTDDPDKKRASQHTANHVLTVLKAALNSNCPTYPNRVEWVALKKFRNVDIPRVRWIKPNEAKRLINACEPDFRLLVQAALLTGCRYSELTAMEAAQVDTESARIFLPHTKSGRPRHVYLTREGVDFFAERVAGLLRHDLVFTRADGDSWQKNHQARRMKIACALAKIAPPIGFHGLRHSYASWLASAGVPLQQIARAIGDVDTRIVEKHYAHLAPSDVQATLQANLPTIGGVERSNVSLAK